jgi:hypothetical protein
MRGWQRLGSVTARQAKARLSFGTFFSFKLLPYMPRYFFHIHHERSSPDLHGEEFADRHAAWHDAVGVAGRSLIDLGGRFQPGRTWTLEVADEFADTLYVIHVKTEKRP